MSDNKVKKKSDKKKEKSKKENEENNTNDKELNIFGDLDVRQINEEKEREEMYEKKLELIRNLYYRTK